METITIPALPLLLRSGIPVGKADSFPIKPKQRSRSQVVGITNFLLAKTKANTAAKATAREQFVYGYMRSLRERI